MSQCRMPSLGLRIQASPSRSDHMATAAKEDKAAEQPAKDDTPVHISVPMTEAIRRICDRTEEAKKRGSE